MELDEARDLFPIVGRWIYLNNAGAGPMSERSRAAVESLLDSLSRAPVAGGWHQEEADRVRERLGLLFRAPAEHFAFTRSTTHGISLLANGLDWRPGDNVVGARGEYPANVYPWMNLAPRGVEYRQAPSPGGRVDPDAVLALVDARTRVVALSLVEFWNGYRVDVETIGRECRRRGVLLALDAMQAAGALDLDLSRLPVDFLASGAGKWMLGPVGFGFAYLTADLLERVRPTIAGVGSMRRNTEYFDYELEFATTARRFEEAALAPLPLAAFGAAVDVFLEVGMDAVERRVLALASRLAEGLAESGYEVVGPWPRRPEERSGIVSFRKPGGTPGEVLRDLAAAHIVGRQHADFIRLSPHFYNTEDEIDRVLEVLGPR